MYFSIENVDLQSTNGLPVEKETVLERSNSALNHHTLYMFDELMRIMDQ